MEIHWTTVVLEIINFLVLVWLLHRFLYRPVLRVIDRRRKTIEETLTNANAVRQEAESLEQHYQHRLNEWEDEKAAARLRFQEELDAEREQRMKLLQNELQAERERSRVLTERHQRELNRHAEERALGLATQFAAALLGRLASPHLEASLVDAVLDDLDELPEARRTMIQEALQHEEQPIRIDSAFPLDEAQRKRVTGALEGLAGHPLHCQFGRDETLKAGLRIRLEHWVLGANLADELQHFYELGSEVGYEVRRGRQRAS